MDASIGKAEASGSEDTESGKATGAGDSGKAEDVSTARSMDLPVASGSTYGDAQTAWSFLDEVPGTHGDAQTGESAVTEASATGVGPGSFVCGYVA